MVGFGIPKRGIVIGIITEVWMTNSLAYQRPKIKTYSRRPLGLSKKKKLVLTVYEYVHCAKLQR
jgi:hypothetical protein